jgi:hypothetical protein
MSSRTPKTKSLKPAPPAGWNSAALDQHVRDVVRTTISEAERALDGALAVLRAIGVYGTGSSSRPIPQSFALKLAACVRLAQWEEAGIAAALPAGLPTSGEVWDDLITSPRTGKERFPGRELAMQVFRLRLGQMAWHPPTPSADVVVGDLSGPELVDELAALLFQFRHLVDQHRPDMPEKE